MVVLHMIDDINLVKEYAGVEDVERGIVDSPGEDNIFEELQPVSMVNLLLDCLIPNRYRLVEMCRSSEELPVVGLVSWKFWVVCGRRLEGSYYRDEFAPRTFEHADDPIEHVVL